jgi:hypothetical protein
MADDLALIDLCVSRRRDQKSEQNKKRSTAHALMMTLNAESRTL